MTEIQNSDPGAGAVDGEATPPGTTTPPAGAGGESLIAQGTEFINSLPETMRTNPTISKFHSAEAMGNAYIALQQKMGGNADTLVRLPEPGGSMDAVYNQLGRPETVEGYTKQEFKQEHFHVDEGMIGNINTLSHNLGLSDKQNTGLLQGYADLESARIDAALKVQEESTAKSVESLKSEWGDDYEKNMEMVRRVMGTFGNEEVTKAVDASGLGSDPGLVKMLALIGSKFSETTTHLGEVGVFGGDPASEIEALNSNKEHQEALKDADHLGHAAALLKQKQLFERLHPKEGS